MKYIFLLIFNLILFTGCVNINPEPPLKLAQDKKQELIKKANTGDIKAMLELNKFYLFPQTKEGLELFTKWTDLVLENKNYEDMMAFIKIYAKYQNMFINGKENHLKLLYKAASLGFKEPLYLIQDIYIKSGKNYKYEEFREIENKILKNSTQDDVIKLYDVYNKNYRSKDANRIRDYMNLQGYTPNLNTQFSILKSLLKQKNQDKKIRTILDNTLASKNFELIEKTAELLLKRRYFDEALSFYQKALELKKQAHIYYSLAMIYKKKRMQNYTWKTREFENEINENLYAAALLDHFEASKALLRTYYYEKKYAQKYEKLQKELLELDESKRALAYIYMSYDKKNKNKAFDILDELASKNNEKAIIELATKANIRANKKLKSLNKKWQDFVLNSNNARLMQKAKKAVHFYKYARFKELREFVDKIQKIQEDEKNILILRSLYKKYKGKDEQKAQEYIQKAIEAGDMFSANSLIKQYRLEGGQENISKAIKLYEKLSAKGDKTSTKRLADIYYFGINGEKYMVNNKKALYYMEKAFEAKDTYTLKKLAKSYLLGDKDIADFTKAKIYIKELAKQNYGHEIFNLTWKLDKKKIVEQKEILELYEMAGDAGHSEAYYAMAWIYYHINQDYTNSLKYLEKGAQKYNTNSLVMLGNLYLYGQGVKKDITKAIEYYEIAGDNSHALYNLGYAYSTINDYKKSLYFYKKSAKKNNKMANFALALIYQNGFGVKKDISQAIKYYKKADTPEAKKQIELLEKN